MNIINDNFKGNKGSFIYYFHEKREFNEKLFKLLLYEIIEVMKNDNYLSNDKNKNLFKQLFHIYSYITNSLRFHYDNNDLFQIKNLPKNINVWLDRFTFILKMYLENDYNSLLSYEDDLGNIMI